VTDALAYDGVYPNFVKPVCGGSSIGVSLVEGPGELEKAVQLAFEEDSRILIEEAIQGRELAVGIVGDRALPAIEIKCQNTFYDYAAKYEDNRTQYVFPEDLPSVLLEDIQEKALKAHRILGCEGFSRVDLLVSGKGIYVLEVNAIPGLTTKSLLPKEAQREGVVFSDLCVMIMTESMKSRNTVT